MQQFPKEITLEQAHTLLRVCSKGQYTSLCKLITDSIFIDAKIIIDKRTYDEVLYTTAICDLAKIHAIFGEPCPFKDGELIWVRSNSSYPWELRYATGKMIENKIEVYSGQRNYADPQKLSQKFVYSEFRKAPGIRLPE